jgi:diaminopimelate epimerase
VNIPFTKMQGLGNDFIVIDSRDRSYALDEETIRRICCRRKGIGADQLLLIEPSKRADFKMRVFNSDGGEVEMCGNGLRCCGRYVGAGEHPAKNRLSVETAAGIRKVRIKGSLVTVDMGRPVLDGEKIPTRLSGTVVDREVEVGGSRNRITCVSMGNPHCVIYVDNLSEYPVSKVGPKIERDPLFPKRVNVEFVKVESPERISMRVWERGAGETVACGTGACAAVVAGSLSEKIGRRITVDLLGGELEIEWMKDDHVHMTGPAEEVFKGEITL